MSFEEKLKTADPDIYEAIRNEAWKQHSKLQLIASENYVSEAVLQAAGSVMTNKYAEGYAGKRYYGGCEFVDVAETLAIERAKKLFQCEHANVQPHSGSQANMAAYFSVLQPGDTILGMNLSHGGHLTHGSPVNFSGRFFKVVAYGVDPTTETIDYDELQAVASRERPKVIVAGATVYPRIIDFARFRKIADSVGAHLITDMAHIAGLVAAGVHPSPVPHSHIVTSTTHKTLRGPRGGLILCTADLQKAVDKNVFPGIQGGPLMHVVAAKAVAFKEALEPTFKAYQEQIVKNARALAAELVRLGFKLISGGTDNHLMLVDLRNMGITGKEAVVALDRAGVVVNKNAIPFDPLPPAVSSGIRLGSPSVTTRGMKEPEMKEIAAIIHGAIRDRDDARAVAGLAKRGLDLCAAFPLYPAKLKEYGLT
jgi:glycine hydroxymethyltransferase